jgi:hypothetical protein
VHADAKNLGDEMSTARFEKVKRTLFSFEVPLAHLYDFHDDQDFIFSLNHLYENTDYRRYIEHCFAEGTKTVWLDNSFNEFLRPTPVIALKRTYNSFGGRFSKVIAPDALTWPKEKIAQKCLKTKEAMPKAEVLCVTKSPEVWEYVREFGCAVAAAIPYRTLDEWSGTPFSGNFLHFLGYTNPESFRFHRPNTCDTSTPIKIAMQNLSFEEWVALGCPHIHTYGMGPGGRDFFSARLSPEIITLAKKNIRAIKERAVYDRQG